MFAIILNLKIDAAIFAQRRQYRRDKAVAPAAYRSFFAIQRDLADEEAIAASVGGLAFLIIDQREGLVRRQAIMALERRPDVGGCKFAAGRSEERRGGKEWVGTCICRRCPSPK